MAQKRTQYVKTADGLEKQLISSAADIVEIDLNFNKEGIAVLSHNEPKGDDPRS